MGKSKQHSDCSFHMHITQQAACIPPADQCSVLQSAYLIKVYRNVLVVPSGRVIFHCICACVRVAQRLAVYGRQLAVGLSMHKDALKLVKHSTLGLRAQ
jgi:hypothetical protein